MKKTFNLAKTIWTICLFLFLIVILLMVMDYKINYQYQTHNQLYFYECNDDLCVSEVKDNGKLLFSTYDCKYKICPEYKSKLSDEYVILIKGNTNILYNYQKGTIISEKYDDYELISNRYIIVKKDNLYGIIDSNEKQIINPIYDEIGIHSNNYLSGYNVSSIIAKKNNKYGLISYKDGKMIDDFKYTDENINELLEKLKEKEK